MLRDLRIDHLLGDGFGRVSLVMDGRRVLLTRPRGGGGRRRADHRRDKRTHAAVVNDPTLAASLVTDVGAAYLPRRRGSAKPRLTEPGARLASDEASTPVAMSW